MMAKFVPKGKLSKKAQKELNRQRRVTWAFSPVTKTVESRKRYNRKKDAHDREDDYGMGFFLCEICAIHHLMVKYAPAASAGSGFPFTGVRPKPLKTKCVTGKETFHP